MTITCAKHKIGKRDVVKYLKNHRYKLCLISVCVLFSLSTGLLWLSLGILTCASAYFMFLSIKKTRFGYFISLPAKLFAIVSLAILIRLFIFEIYNVPTGSMEDTLFPGDYIIVSKLNYGPKMPQSPFEIPWINLLFYARGTGVTKNDEHWWAYKRLNGFSKVAAGDIVIFKSLTDSKKTVVKRCIGLPGNYLQISKGAIFVNSRLVKTDPTVKSLYTIWPNNFELFTRFADSLHITYTVKTTANKQYCVESTLNAEKRRMVERFRGIDSVVYLVIKGQAYPGNKQIGWSPDNFGPVLIPFKGMKIQLDRRNLLLYHQVFENELSARYRYDRDGFFYLNEKQVREYTVKQNYYFVMGDNRNYSFDSRFWGFVPEGYIIGKEVLKVFASSPAKREAPAKDNTLIRVEK
ncbi:signal peptidase I [Mucilaginibacter sp.]|uniref:signal peptidase I n=1 Tax=Mucilaginibacter sp. TaxID=1882438 RepID=UPI002ED5E0CF